MHNASNETYGINDGFREAHVSDDYIAYRAKRFSMISKFQNMWDRHSGRIKATKHRTKLISP